MGRRLFWVLVLVAWGPGQTARADSLLTARKEIRALRVNPQALRVDGRLDDEAWQRAQFVSDFLQ